MAIGKNIKFHRKTRLGWTLERLENESGVDRGTISALENRDSNKSEHFTNIAKALGITVEELQIEPLQWIADRGKTKLADGGLTVKISTSSIDIPLLNVSASMGNGQENEHEIFLENIQVNSKTADKLLAPYSGHKNLAFITAVGDSMAPTFNDGDILLIDTGDKNVTADKVYVLEAHSRLFIKRVRQRLDGTFEISSDNPAVKTVDVLNGDHEVEIKGRVIWAWNGKKL